MSTPNPQQAQCPECRVAIGQEHESGCDEESCPLCEGQLISCECIYTLSGLSMDTLERDHPEIDSDGPTDEMYALYDAEVEKKGGYTRWAGYT